MFKSFRNKLQSLNNKQQNVLMAILILLDLSAIVFCTSLLILFHEKPVSLPVSGGKFLQPGEMPESFKSGEIGEISEEEAQEKGIQLIPEAIFNTQGTISVVQADRLMVEGDGSSFADQLPRTIVVVFTDSTITFGPGQKTTFIGLEGLKTLKEGMNISINGDENIRGKTEFKAKTINQ